MVSPGKIYIWNETDWDEDRCIEIRANAETCSLLFYDSELDSDIAVLGEASISPELLCAAAKGRACEVMQEGGSVKFRRDGDWTYVSFAFDEFPLYTEWQFGALWFQSAVWNCVSPRDGDYPFPA